MYTIETARLWLRPFTPADADAYHHQIFADAEVMHFLLSDHALPYERTVAILRRTIDHWQQHGFGLWGVEEKSDGGLIGHCGLQFLPETQEIEVAYALGKPFWGRGFATEGARASLRFGFEHLGLDRIIALALPENAASRRVMVKNGMTYEGNAHYFGFELARYAIDRADFQPGKGPYLLRRAGGRLPDTPEFHP